MREIKIDKVVLSISNTGDDLDKGAKLLERITGKKPVRKKSLKRIPTLGVRPGLEVGAMITLRGQEAIDILKKLLAAVENRLKRRQISENSFSFGIKEYIEIPGMQYQRDIGMRGLEASISFIRAGKRVAKKKIKRGNIPKKQNIPKEEIIKYLEEKLDVTFFGKA